MAVSGDFSKLSAWEKALKRAPKALQEISPAMAEAFIEKVQECFEEQRDPYGKPWPGKALPDGRPILSGKTARLRRGWHRKQTSKGGFTIAPSVDYATHHQLGTGIYGRRGTPIKPKRKKALAFTSGKQSFAFASVKGAPQRMMIPTRERGLPPDWRKAAEEVCVAVLGKHIQPKKRSSSRTRSRGGGSRAQGGVNAMALIRKAMRSISGE